MNTWATTQRQQPSTSEKRAAGSLLQRACACGRHAGNGGECVECRKKRLGLQRRAVASERGQGPDVAPPIVHDVLRSPGRPLDEGTRGFMESRFGHDFSGVRVHTDGRAAESARAVNALAYTVGNHVAFDAGQYAPGTSAGRGLLAHELAHVVQQDGRASDPQLLLLASQDSPAEREAACSANALAAGRQAPAAVTTPPMVSRQAPAPVSPAVPIPATPAAPAPAAPTPLPSCIPAIPLQWSDFAGAVPRSSGFGALTFSNINPTAIAGQNIIQAVFNRRRSWVRPQFANPTNRATNGCGPEIRDCERHFDRLSRQGYTGGTYSLGAPTGCAAAIGPDPSVQATSRGECATVLGTECDRVSQLESARLLRHEQGHFDIACRLAALGTQSLQAGHNQRVTMRSVAANSRRLQGSYDTQTNHGCDAAGQATWEADIAAGLPSVTIP